MEMLKIAEGFDWSKTPDNSAEYLHRMVEIARLAQADSYQYVSDPRFVTDRSKLLLSDNYAQAQRQRINPNRATTGKVQPGDVVAWSEKVPVVSELPSNMQTSIVAMEDSIRDMNYRGNTNHVVVTDKWGNAVSFTHTLGQFFGAQDVLGSTGVIGNNGMDWFDLDKNPWTEKASNLVVAPNKRNRWTLSPGMVFKNNKPYILVGGSGAESTMSGIFQTLIRVLEYKLNPQAAISSPRFLYGDMYHYTAGTRLHVEPELRGSFRARDDRKGIRRCPGLDALAHVHWQCLDDRDRFRHGNLRRSERDSGRRTHQWLLKLTVPKRKRDMFRRSFLVTMIGIVLALPFSSNAADIPKIKEPVLFTALGQSPDAKTLSVLGGRARLNGDFKPLATADDVAAVKTVFVTVGTSLKGFGAAGVNLQTEIARSAELVKAAKAKGVYLILVHIGGEGRRDAMTNTLLDKLAPARRRLHRLRQGQCRRLFQQSCGGKPLVLTPKTLDVVKVLESIRP
ncbi:MAG: gamma-glutamyltransferase [Betaproteobacteria bacterium]|nr:gamma-glutamyltransferase [Betaproteobacteria bacterium]